ncbi:hypothetical protein HN652_01910 [archaeon]|jgi:hypothetical protein|nr:hypothetical protein [archaeon]MBT6868750.1 hypothetical protein [archaeon]MBT7193029.1 hypothetical protein [archaeon]MBT7380995.1 hypothetical protein [archaeon]MBT7507750.1 hypothetical protein [archaeon]
MKKIHIINLLILLILIIGCMPTTIKDLYEAGPEGPTGKVTLELNQIYSMNSFLGLPDSNALKMYDVCYDESIDQAYSAGIMTSDIAVYEKVDETYKVVDYLPTEIGIGEFELKYLLCGEGSLYIIVEDAMYGYDGITFELMNSFHFKKEISLASAYLDNENIIISTIENNTNIVLDKTNLNQINEFELGLTTKFSVEGSMYSLGIEDHDIYSYDENYDKEYYGSIDFSTKPDSIIYSNNELWMLIKGKLMIYDFENLDEKPIAVNGIVPDPNDLYVTKDYVVVVTENGFDDGTIENYKGGFSVISIETKEVLYETEIVSKHKRGSVGFEDNLLFLTNNDYNSITIIDLESGEYDIISQGSSVEGGIITKEGKLFLRNRLGGGDKIFMLDLNDNSFEELEVGGWPVGIAYDPDLDQVFTFDFLASEISVLNSLTGEKIDEFELGVPEGETDGIGIMSYDYTNKILYPVIPEQNVVVAIDAVSGEVIKVIDVEEYDVNYEDLGGPGVLISATYEPEMKLYVYANVPKMVYVYDGLNDYQLVEEISIDKNKGLVDFPYSLFVDNFHDKMYIGENVYDATTDEYLRDTTTEYSVFAVDNDDGLLFSVKVKEQDNELERLIVMNTNMEQLDAIDMASNQYVKSRFTYDPNSNKMYVFYMVSSEVWVYDVLIE